MCFNLPAMKTAYGSVLLIILSFICTSANAQRIDTMMVEFVQEGKVFEITSATGAIALDKKPFSIRFYNRRYDEANEKYYAAQIAVLNKPDNGIEVGMERDEIPFLAGGTGIATSLDDGTLFLSEDGHHYLYYGSEEDRMVHLISKHGEWLKLEWRIKGFFADDTDSNIEDLKYKQLYFIFLFDRNLNDKIDEGELKKVVVAFR
jgi:hypothetical protein